MPMTYALQAEPAAWERRFNVPDATPDCTYAGGGYLMALVSFPSFIGDQSLCLSKLTRAQMRLQTSLSA
ncbi:hypothetical protein Lepto7375DRAFT_7474 [Leptolyngbya sp. PCC 7375]|nr:hypothetical protein Lepto7375DRAFT_7474 [Leptolyngbya sp. PCC 7375]